MREVRSVPVEKHAPVCLLLDLFPLATEDHVEERVRHLAEGADGRPEARAADVEVDDLVAHLLEVGDCPGLAQFELLHLFDELGLSLFELGEERVERCLHLGNLFHFAFYRIKILNSCVFFI